jgi:hypothetical protein
MKTSSMSNKRALLLLLAALLVSLILSIWSARSQPFYASDPYDEEMQYRRAWRYLMN